MNRGHITALFLIEGILQALLGIALGWVLGLGVVAYMTYVGFAVPADTAALIEGFAFGTTMYGAFAPAQYVIFSLLLLVIVSLVSLYPASFAAKMEPVEALHSL
jgi:ABC-type lipoprotein release transport system permease subunit